MSTLRTGPVTGRGWRSLLCRFRGHDWQTAEITGYHPNGRLFVRGTRRLCLRCPARAAAPH